MREAIEGFLDGFILRRWVESLHGLLLFQVAFAVGFVVHTPTTQSPQKLSPPKKINEGAQVLQVVRSGGEHGCKAQGELT